MYKFNKITILYNSFSKLSEFQKIQVVELLHRALFYNYFKFINFKFINLK